MRRHIAIVLAALLMLTASAAGMAEEIKPNISDVRTVIGEACVAYPRLEGMADAEAQARINDDIVTNADITSHIVTLATLGNSAWGLCVDYEAYIGGGVFSVVISAKGKQPNGRNGHKYTALSYDLRTGKRLTASDIFVDVNEAAAAMEELLSGSLSEELNGYMDNCELSPLPIEAFTVDADGISFWYPSEQFAYLSEYSGSCQFNFCELEGLLIDTPDGIPARLHAIREPIKPQEAREAIEALVKEGRLPHVPVALDEPMTEVIKRLRLMRTPDDFPGGRYYRMEAPKLRGAYIISDNMRGQSEWEHSVVEGLRIERGELCGLVVGKAVRADWLEMLGEPQETIEYTEGMAYDYALPIGQSDVYVIGGRTLSLHADDNGTLRCVRLQKQ